MNTNVEIFDNFLPQDVFRNLANLMISEEFPWYFSPGKVHEKEMEENKNIFQFIHMFYTGHNWRGNFGPALYPFLEILKPYALSRIKANLTTITPNIIKYRYHRDHASLVKSHTAIFYVNTNNGLTIFNSGQEVKSVGNRLIVFDANELHTGTSCTDEPYRIVINFNYCKTFT